MTTTKTTTENRSVYLLGGASFNSFYERQSRDHGHEPTPIDEHLGGGWWLSIRDRVWINGIEWRVHHQASAIDPSEFKRVGMPTMDGDVTPDHGLRIDQVLYGGGLDVWEVFARAMRGTLGEYARKAVALPSWHRFYQRPLSEVLS